MIKKTKYIFINNIYIKSKYIDNEYTYYSEKYISYNRSDCIEKIKDVVISMINEDLECTIDNFNERYDYNLRIDVIPTEHLEFEDYPDDIDDFCKLVIPSINKDTLYDFLLLISDCAYEEYDHRGNLIKGSIETFSRYGALINITYKDIGLTAPMFFTGDIVTKRGYPDKLYKVYYSLGKDFRDNTFPMVYLGTVSIIPLQYDIDKEIDLDDIIEYYARSELILVERYKED